MRIHSFLRVLLYGTLSTISAFAWSVKPAKAYQLEVILFQQAAPKQLASEYWRDTPPWTDTHTLKASSINSNRADSVTPDKLSNVVEQLKKQKDTSILLHQAWRIEKTILNRPVLLALTNVEHVDPSIDITTNTLVTGSIRLSLRRYFNAALKLHYRIPRTSLPSNMRSTRHCDGSEYCHYYMQEKRRTRSMQLNYLDHPIIGVLFEVFPLSS